MADQEPPRLYLITPPEFELSRFPDELARILDAADVACVRLALSSHDEDRLCRAADACREVTTARDVALVIETHFMLADRLGLDGVHLSDGPRTVRKARKALGPDAIVGSGCKTSRHEGMSAAESSADYISFAPAGATPLGDGTQAEPELFEWWSQMIEVPVVAEGALDVDTVRALTPYTDFFALGAELWDHDTPLTALSSLMDAMHG